MSARRGSGGLEFALSSILLGLLVVLGTIGVSRREVFFDVTEGQRRTLAPQTVRVLEMVERPTELVGFFAGIPEEEQRVQDLVERYRAINPALSFRSVDPDRRPDLAEAYGVTANGTVVLVDGDLRLRMVRPNEARLTAALVRLISYESPVVFFVTGHGEASVEDTGPAGWSDASRLLAEQNFDVRLLASSAIERVPDSAALLVFAGPEVGFDPRESALFVDYVLRGGRILAMLEPFGSTSIDSLIERFGVSADPGFVVDLSDEQQNVTRGGDRRIALAVGGNAEHPITRDFTFNALFPLARSLQARQPVPSGVEAIRLLGTSQDSWNERDPEQTYEGRLEFDEGVDRGGPLGLAYASEVNLRRFQLDGDETSATLTSLLDLWGDTIDLRDSTQIDSLRVGDLSIPRDLAEIARIVVIGDADFASNANLRVQGNSELLLGSVLWLTEQEDRIALPARPDRNDPIVFDQRTVNAMRLVGIGLVPLLFFSVGIWTLWRRRQWV